MRQTMTGIAKQAARLLLIELFVPGGTLILISILLAGRIPAISNRFAVLSPFPAASKQPGHQHDLVAYWGLRRIR